MKAVLFTIIALCFILSSCKMKSKNQDLMSHENAHMTYSQFQNKFNYFDSANGKMSYVDEGEGEVILLMHGVPTSSWLYRKIIPILVENGYRVIAPDMLGYGGSEKPEGYDIYSSDNMARRTLALMSQLKIESWSQVFHDGGGLWTWAMLKQDPKRIDHLFMLNTIVYQEGFKPPIKFNEGLLAGLFSRMYSSSAGQKIVLDVTFKNGVNNKNVITSEMLEGYKKPFLKSGHGGIYYFFAQTKTPLEDFTSLHKSLNIPLCVIWGKNDDMLVWDEIEEQVKTNFKIDDSNIHVLNAKHFIQEEQPEKISEIIVSDLKK